MSTEAKSEAKEGLGDFITRRRAERGEAPVKLPRQKRWIAVDTLVVALLAPVFVAFAIGFAFPRYSPQFDILYMFGGLILAMIGSVSFILLLFSESLDLNFFPKLAFPFLVLAVFLATGGFLVEHNQRKEDMALDAQGVLVKDMEYARKMGWLKARE